jgi:hypothetical protein
MEVRTYAWSSPSCVPPSNSNLHRRALSTPECIEVGTPNHFLEFLILFQVAPQIPTKNVSSMAYFALKESQQMITSSDAHKSPRVSFNNAFVSIIIYHLADGKDPDPPSGT